MVSQTENYGTIDAAEVQGGRYMVQYGHAKFLAKRKRCTLATRMEYVKYANFTWRSGRPGVTKTSGLTLYCTGTVAAGAVYVNRATLGGGVSGGTFWYELLGW